VREEVEGDIAGAGAGARGVGEDGGVGCHLDVVEGLVGLAVLGM